MAVVLPPTRPLLVVKVYGTPGPQGSKNTGKTKEGKSYVYESSRKVKPWREVVAAAAMVAMAPGRLNYGHGVAVDMIFTLAKPKGRPNYWPKGEPWSRDLIYRPAGYPDLSKLVRSTEDALTTAGVWADDGRVVETGRTAKVFPNEDPDALDRPGALIRIWALSA